MILSSPLALPNNAARPELAWCRCCRCALATDAICSGQISIVATGVSKGRCGSTGSAHEIQEEESTREGFGVNLSVRLHDRGIATLRICCALVLVNQCTCICVIALTRRADVSAVRQCFRLYSIEGWGREHGCTVGDIGYCVYSEVAH